MNVLRQALADYLAVRRALGYRLARAEKLLAQFLAFVEERGEQHLTIETALAWATAPAGADPNWMSRRLSDVRQFAIHLRGIDPATQVPPADILPGRSRRATPYLYSTEEISTLMAVTATLRGSHRKATYRTLIGLLAATGMRVGEAIGLDRDDFDAICGVLTIRNGKFGKSRELPLHPSTITALGDYLRRVDRPHQSPNVPALFLSPGGARLLYTNVQNTFQRLVRHAGIMPRSAACRPRLHDLRHGFAVNTILDAYRDSDDAGARLAILSTYLGHINPVHIYWYLSASPELLKLAGDRLERHLEHQRRNGARTRNARLAAIRSLLRYAALRHPDHAALIERVLAIPPKRFDRRIVTFLTEPEISALLTAPDRSTWTGRRDHTLFSLASQTGLRASELIGLRCADVHLAAGAHVSCQGKGRKQRITPLTSGLVTSLRVWLAERAGLPGAPLFVTRSGKALSRDAREHRLAKYLQLAGGVCPTLMQKSVTMHVLRHSAAMRLLHAGIDTSVIALWLGHENVETTQVYLHADLTIKERALARTTPAETRPGRFRPTDKLLAFLEAL